LTLEDKHPSGTVGLDDGAGTGDELLTARLREAIHESGGAIDFSEFMQRVLYEPGLGYYVAGQRKFGPGGDFVTAPQMGDLFGRCLARQCGEVLQTLGGGDLLEFGAGDGRLAVQMLDALDHAGRLPARYCILEVSPDLKDRQRRTIEAHRPDLVERCHWLERLPDSFEGAVVANEVLDAMPVERFRVAETGLEVIQVAWRDGSFVETARPAAPAELPGIAGQVAERGLPAGYESEAGVLAQQWVAGIVDWLECGVVLIIDYGFPAHEFFHPERARGTLMCHHRHRAHTDPYCHVGMQDITAHLDFSALAGRAADAGLDVLGFTHQAGFLLSLGLLDLAKADMTASQDDRWSLSQQVQTLTQSYEMGELFKVLALGRCYPADLAGFDYLDHRARL